MLNYADDSGSNILLPVSKVMIKWYEDHLQTNPDKFQNVFKKD